MALEKDAYGHPRIPLRGHYDVHSCNERRKWAENFTSSTLEVTGEWWKNEGANDSVSCKKLQGNIENPIGLAKIPIGLAGPVLINGDNVSGYVVCPFATTEGALVASATRGAAVLTRSGGVRCRVFEQVMIRSPVFITTSVDNAEILYTWILMNKQGIQKQIKLYSEFSLLINIDVQRFGKNIVILLKCTTSDAAGQNMVTTVTWHTCKWIIEAFEAQNPSIKIIKFFVESMYSGDKRMTFENFSSHRGIHVIAEAWIPKSVIESTFKTTVEDILTLYGIMRSSCTRNGTIGCNINVANTLAAIFTATGQDIAGVVECAADLIIEPGSYSQSSSLSDLESGIYVCLILPSLVIGTVGGGTALATQMECLKMINCYGTGKVARLAEIIAAYALSLDLSTLASVSNGTFALSHERLGKNRPEFGFKKEHINDDLFSNVIKDIGTLVSWTPFSVNTGNSILSELAKSERLKKIIGHFGFKIQYQNKQGQNSKLKVVLKSKTVDTETCNVINKMAQNCGFSLANNHEKYKRETGFKDCHIRELNLASLNDSVLQQYIPNVYCTIIDEKNEIFVYIMEYLTRDGPFSHLNSADDISEWTIPDVKVILRDLAKIHGHFISQRKEWLHNTQWLYTMGPNKMNKLKPLWMDLLKHAELEFPDFWNSEKVKFLCKVIEDIPHYWSGYEIAPKTLVHNDCNPRNICIRRPSTNTMLNLSNDSFPYNDPRLMCVYDWELARIDVPQHDLVEFLAFSLPVETNLTTRKELIEFYRKHFELYSGIIYPNENFMTHYNIACLDFAVNRLLLYTMGHTYKDYLFLPRVIESHFSYIFKSIKTLSIKKSKL